MTAARSNNLTPVAGERVRTLSKSDFKLARTCDAKLFFRENAYPDNRESSPYLQLLADGGYMVEALAKARYPGVQLGYGGAVAEGFARTLEHLRQDRVTLFEATLLVGRQQARVDILQKEGRVVRLVEVKAKSFNGLEHTQSLSEGKAGAFRGSRKPHAVLADWEEKVEDVAFQMLLLEKVLPDCIITPYLVLIDTSKRAEIDNIPALFEIERRLKPDGTSRVHTARYIGSREQLDRLDLVTEVDVSKEVALLRGDVEQAASWFEARLDSPLTAFAERLDRGSKCVHCEFRPASSDVQGGFAECWGPLAAPKPHVLELYKVGMVKTRDRDDLVGWMFRKGEASLFEVPEEFLAKKDGTIGPDALRQRRQIEYTRRNEVFVGPSLSSRVDALRQAGPLHFIDFETSRLALPYHHGMRPYGLVTFQWSCHSTASLGGEPTHSEWLNDTDVWPNQAFAESLRQAIGDSGPVLTWSHFEASVLKEILRDLATFGRNSPDLVAWMTDVFDRRIVDLHEWARLDYYHPGMRGRTSIKVVLDALWRSDEVMRQQFASWTGYAPDASRDPYASLPAVEINGIAQDVHEGTGAMRAYQEMMYGSDKGDPEVRAKWGKLLKQYCALDTLSMVLILEHWRRAVAL